ncbi:MAG TPA: methyltransferase domain-containing protein [bacterium]|nr:methyltransferase domain-containing protein [bacterium]HOL47059.1 methyltransferase domain-containing protein [bacterium]HPQ17936.1 methyltransferase domain-containing protein [bacterium]
MELNKEIIITNQDIEKYQRFDLLQKKDLYKVSIDSLLLIEYVIRNIFNKPIKNEINVLDIGSGNGVLDIITCDILKNERIKFYGIEIQRSLYELSRENLKKFGLEKQIEFINMDINKYRKEQKLRFDVLISNPPFYPKSESLLSPNESNQIAKFEIKLTIEQLFENSVGLLKDGGIFCFINILKNYKIISSLIKKFNFKILNISKIKFFNQKETNKIICHLKK